jgi:ribonuclease III
LGSTSISASPPKTDEDRLAGAARLEERLGHRFLRAELLQQALTHRSYGTPHNERLEFLGDGVLDCVIRQELYDRFPALSEGELSRLRASLVRRETLAALAHELGVGAHVRLGEGESSSGGAQRPSILSDALEALYGAVLLDGGYERAHAAICTTFASLLASLDARALAKDPKTQLQEFLQGRGQALPTYCVLATQGAPHRQSFEVECVVEELGLRATGRGDARRAAEQQAAEAMLRQLKA